METERIALSQRERDRLKVLHEVQEKHLSQLAAAERLQLTDRQVRRMLLRIREHGVGALVLGLIWFLRLGICSTSPGGCRRKDLRPRVTRNWHREGQRFSRSI
jgi:hypothetical protein